MTDPHRPLARELFDLPETYAATRLPVDLATTLIPDAYTSPEFYELEQQRVFARFLGRGRDDLRRRGARRLRRGRGRRTLAHRLPEQGRRAARVRQRVPAPGRADLRSRRARRPLLPVSVPRVGVRPRWRASRHTAVHARLAGAARPAWHLRHVRCQGVRQGRLRSSSRTRRQLRTARRRVPRSRCATARRPRRRPEAAPRRVSHGRVGGLPHGDLRDRGELEARRRELHGVLPPPVGASGPRQGLADERPLPLAGPGQLRRVLHDARSRATPTRAAGRACRRSPG